MQTSNDSDQNANSIPDNGATMEVKSTLDDAGNGNGIGHFDTGACIASDVQSLEHIALNSNSGAPSLTDSNNDNHENHENNETQDSNENDNDSNNDSDNASQNETKKIRRSKTPIKQLRRSPRRKQTKAIAKPSKTTITTQKRHKRKRKSTEKAEYLRLEEIEKEKKIQKEKEQRAKRTKRKKQQKGKGDKDSQGGEAKDITENKKKQKKEKPKKKVNKNLDDKKTITCQNDNDSTTSSLDEQDIICCICRCGVDFSEREAFQNDDDLSPKCTTISNDTDSQCEKVGSQGNDMKNEDETNAKKESTVPSEIMDKDKNCSDDDDESSVPYCGVKLPKDLYDPNNAIIICDTPGCNRSYHQRCHFVPVFCLPRGSWHCLICQMKENIIKEESSSKKKKRKPSTMPAKKQNKKQNTNDDKSGDEEIHTALSKPLTIDELDSLYPIQRNGVENLSDDKKEYKLEKIEQKRQLPIVSLQERFEFQSASLKATMLNTELKRRIKSTIDSALSIVRLEEHTIRGCTETERAKKSLMENFTRSKRVPQQLLQSVDRMAYSKTRIRDLMLSIDSVIRNRDDRKELFDWFTKEKTTSLKSDNGIDNNKVDWNLLESKLFFGDVRRKEPRFDISDYDGDIEDDNEDEDPTKKIICCVCFNGQVHPDNDVVMCDGKNCFRAFHMKCCNPIVTQKMLDDDEQGTWFCPYCCALANSIHYTQDEYFGDEMDDEECREDASTNSWDEAKDVFPEAVVELSSAQLWKRGHRNDDSDKYLSSLLGTQLPDINNNDNSMSDDDSDHSFSMADVEENGSISDSSSTSKVSGENNVNLEWKVDKDEIEALSCSSNQESISSDDQEEGKRRTRSSIRSKEKNSKDIGTIDEENILYSKRNRTKVDYRR